MNIFQIFKLELNMNEQQQLYSLMNYNQSNLVDIKLLIEFLKVNI
jgi:hypothetical protein